LLIDVAFKFYGNKVAQFILTVNYKFRDF